MLLPFRVLKIYIVVPHLLVVNLFDIYLVIINSMITSMEPPIAQKTSKLQIGIKINDFNFCIFIILDIKIKYWIIL